MNGRVAPGVNSCSGVAYVLLSLGTIAGHAFGDGRRGLRSQHSWAGRPAALRALARTPLLSAALYGGALAARDIGSDARELTIARLQAELATHRISVRSIEAHYAARIEALDAHGPSLRSVLEINPDAAAIAAQLDSVRGDRGALYGVPVLLKDNIDTADRMLTTAGSLALLDSKPARDAFIVQRLRPPALVLGKTNLSEWANYRSKRSSSGWSGRGGQTKNPYALDRNPCGSSSGSGTAIAADPAIVAVGDGDRRLDHLPGERQRPGGHQADRGFSSRAPASSPFQPARTPRGRWRGPWRMRRRC